MHNSQYLYCMCGGVINNYYKLRTSCSSHVQLSKHAISEYAPDIACDKIHFFDQN